jgi:alpha-ketoglutarate-dependent taurine dioxygenase
MSALRELTPQMLERATRPEQVYTHHWQVGDLVMWDNRCTLHRGRPWDESRYRRVMHRTTVAGEGPTAPELPDAVVCPPSEDDLAWCRAQLELVSA